MKNEMKYSHWNEKEQNLLCSSFTVLHSSPHCRKSATLRCSVEWFPASCPEVFCLELLLQRPGKADGNLQPLQKSFGHHWRKHLRSQKAFEQGTQYLRRHTIKWAKSVVQRENWLLLYQLESKRYFPLVISTWRKNVKQNFKLKFFLFILQN